MVVSRAVAWAPGACGELVQGVIDGRDFLVTCPIARYSRVSVEVIGSTLDVPEDCSKLRDALQRTLDLLGAPLDLGLRVQVSSDLLRGKGLASSTADIAAGVAALGRLLDRELTPRELASVALQVEPTDGLMFPGLACFDHRRGTWQESLGSPPPMELLVFDAGGEVDTLTFNGREELARLNQAKEGKVRAALALVRQGIEEGRPDMIARGATMSAIANQRLLPKKDLEEIIGFGVRRLGALGLCIAHSGTVLGLLYTPLQQYQVDEAVEAMQREFPHLAFLYHTALVGGGVRWGESLEVNRNGQEYGAPSWR
ncbi:MAG: GHMP kinase [Firmicutes bacterium]|jgi:L-threonine kinase|nr:GHMP kinase [Bacillota bacterium]